jgi:hypothetical protein
MPPSSPLPGAPSPRDVRLLALLCCLVSGAAPGQPQLPPGWKTPTLSDEEKAFVAPEATRPIATQVRTFVTNNGANPFLGSLISPKIVIDNPYLDPADPFFNVPRQIACLPDGAVAVFATAKRHKEGRMKGNPYAQGLWRIAPDGAITAIDRAQPVQRSSDYPVCGVTVGISSLKPEDIGPMALGADGSLVFGYRSSWAFGRYAEVFRITPAGFVEPVPNEPQACAPDPPETTKKRFADVTGVARDPEGNTWIMDDGRCQLLRVAPDGALTVVLDRAQTCPKGDPEHRVSAHFMQWDAANKELVTAGTFLASKPRELFSSIWRIRPDGKFRRVYLARKVGAPPRVDGISGLAVDAKGKISFGAGLLSSGGGYQILKLVDEATGRTEVIAGAPRPTDVNHGDGPAKKAHFGTILGLCVTRDGTYFIHDANRVIRKLSPAGQVTTWGF